MASQQLVADYGSSDSESENEKIIEEEELPILIKEDTTQTNSVNYFDSIPETMEETPAKKLKKEKKKVLANPLRNDAFTKTYVESSLSVFYNPFQKDQEAKNSVLEKHVKLSTNPKDVLEINGKKICWSYRKGRCKFGHKCKYAHDSDIVRAGSVQQNSASTQNQSSNNVFIPSEDAVIQSEPEELKKRRSGLPEGLVPNKRSRKMYKEIQSREAPWINKR